MPISEAQECLAFAGQAGVFSLAEFRQMEADSLPGGWDTGSAWPIIDGYVSPHGQDVTYVFMHLDRSNPQTSESDLEVSEAMGTYWTNFAKTGDPNGEGLPSWPAFSEANREVMYFGPGPHVGPVPSAASLEVLDAYFQWRRTGEGEAWVGNY